MKNILVTGGAGYIGSHIIKELLKQGYNPVTYDNLKKGHRRAVLGGTFIKGDLADKKKLDQTFKKYKPNAVIHLAALSLVGESEKKPDLYFRENVCYGLNLLETMVKYNVLKIVFSSTAAVYGQPKTMPILESFSLKPVNVYGLSKLHFEQILKAYNKSYGLGFVSLRYFNAAGADPKGEIGEDHHPETHLIPRVLKTALGQQKEVTIYGTDYNTPDGTCIRDYIHVTDLAQAHILALKYLEKKSVESQVYNLGNEKGNSVLEVINLAKKITGINFKVLKGRRRKGDPVRLVASSKKIKKELNWEPAYGDLKTIIKTAWQWHKKHPMGLAIKKNH
jgi:UDP-glucose 4-epimerase